MTRPMPEPPECWWYCTPPHGEPGLWTSDMDPAEYMPLTALDKKRLTDAECAAEYWRAEMEAADARGRSWFYEDPATVNAERVKASRAANRARTWRRFATRPHALEEA